MTEAPEPAQATEPVKPASYALMGTRIFTLVIAVVMGALSLEGEQRLAKLGLSGVTVGTLLLTPDIGNAVLVLRVSEQTRKRLADLYIKFLDTAAGAALVAIIGNIVEQVVKGAPLTILVAYLVALFLLGAVIAGGGLPIWLARRSRHSANAADGLPEGKRDGIKRLSVRARIRLARFEANAVPAGIGVVLFLVGTALQFAALATHTTAQPSPTASVQTTAATPSTAVATAPTTAGSAWTASTNPRRRDSNAAAVVLSTSIGLARRLQGI